MQYDKGWIVLVIIFAGLLFPACTDNSNAPKNTEPAHVEHIDGTELSRVTLTERAAERLGIKTTPVTETSASEIKKIVPYSAVLYDENGTTWVYTNPDPLVFVRHKIVVDFIKDDVAFLSEGPPAGTKVVTVGVAELLGTEYKVGH